MGKREKYKSIILYLLFGCCTTLINILVYYISSRIASMPVIPSTVAAWVVAVTFAFLTNKVFVFNSCSWEARRFFYEAFTFFTARMATGILDTAIMEVFVRRLCLYDIFVKALSNILVIIANYIASKMVVFKGTALPRLKSPH